MDVKFGWRREGSAGENRQPDADREPRDLSTIPAIGGGAAMLGDAKPIPVAKLVERLISHGVGQQRPEKRSGKSWRDSAHHDGSATGSPVPHNRSNVLRDSASFALPAAVI